MALGLPHDSPIFFDTDIPSCAMAAPFGFRYHSISLRGDFRPPDHCGKLPGRPGMFIGACILYFIFSLTSGPWIPNRLSSFVPFLYIFLVDTTKQVHTATQSDLPSNFPMLFCEAPYLFNPFRWLELSKLFFDVLEADAAI